MPRFDVYRGPQGEYWLDCQADLLSSLNTRLVAPMSDDPDATFVDARLNPVFDVEGRRVIMQTHLAAAVPTRLLRDHVVSLAEHDFQIIAAFDMLLTGIQGIPRDR